ncbi:nuclear transport factor 2 family protein [Sedimenticola sp.]|uniref:nuclear transport factor 2 family protein n=1 Tax=Sedimenticola sp. TaxID=1940285 RepID=UPI003D10DC90
MTKSALEIVQQYQQLMEGGNQAWTDLIADDVIFTGPAVGEVRGKSAVIDLNNGFLPLIRGYEPVSAFGQEKLALLEGVFTVVAPSGKEISFDIAEIYEVVNGKISAIRIYYDAEEFRKEFDQPS